jgi:hypothetical protein
LRHCCLWHVQRVRPGFRVKGSGRRCGSGEAARGRWSSRSWVYCLGYQAARGDLFCPHSRASLPRHTPVAPTHEQPAAAHRRVSWCKRLPPRPPPRRIVIACLIRAVPRAFPPRCLSPVVPSCTGSRIFRDILCVLSRHFNLTYTISLQNLDLPRREQAAAHHSARAAGCTISTRLSGRTSLRRWTC